jgi:glutamyl-tRNA(Gln) amidotransferase subunit D
VSHSKGAISFPKAVVKNRHGLPKVTMIYTGGTIGSRVDYKTGGVYMLTKPEELLYEVPEASEVANIDVVPLMSIASEDMSYIEWQSIAKEIAKAESNGYDGVVVTHGTDTMHYTAAALSFMLNGIRMPVILTGAQRSSDRGSSDAFANLYCSVVLAAKSGINGVGICMHSTSSDDRCMLLRGTKARKMHTSRRDAFRPINDTPLAYVDLDGNISINHDAYKQPMAGKFSPKTGFEKLTTLIKVHPNSSPDMLRFYAEKGYRGAILEGTGLGHLPVSTEHEGMNWLSAVKDAVDKGMVIGIASQCIYGRTNSSVYRNLRLLSNAGALHCGDMTPETAYVKLGWLLGNYKPEEAKKLFTENIAGEINPRIRYDQFLV